MELIDRPIISINDIPDEGLNITGLTLIFTTPNITVTFTGSNPLLPNTIVSQINTQTSTNIASLVKFTGDGDEISGRRLSLANGSTGVVLTAPGTANAILGISNTVSSVQAAPTAVVNVVHADRYFRAYCKA